MSFFLTVVLGGSALAALVLLFLTLRAAHQDEDDRPKKLRYGWVWIGSVIFVSLISLMSRFIIQVAEKENIDQQKMLITMTAGALLALPACIAAAMLRGQIGAFFAEHLSLSMRRLLLAGLCITLMAAIVAVYLLLEA